MNVTLGDLRISIKAGASVNLLSKHYHFTEEQVKASAESGSIFKKRAVIKVRKFKPAPVKVESVQLEKERHWVPPLKSAVEIKEEVFEALDIVDIKNDGTGVTAEEAQFALETMEAELAATAPVLPKSDIFTKGIDTVTTKKESKKKK
jgi:hypothetical protein